MGALAGFAQQIDSSARNHFAAVANKGLEHLLEVENLGLAVDQGHHIDTKYRLQLSLGIEIIEYYLAHFAAL